MSKGIKDFQLPMRFELEKETASATYGKFSAEPFERGFGTTIGNSLRRVLLSSLKGHIMSFQLCLVSQKILLSSFSTSKISA